MKKRSEFLTILILLLQISVLYSCESQKTEQSKPNIILIMSDDQGWGDMELAGNKIIDTPHLNTIATNGTQFERFYVNPMCAPTRASLLTGKYNLRTGTSWVGRRTDFLRLNETTIAEILKTEGYATGCYGKWHLGAYGPYHPNERGFDDYTGILEGATRNYYNTEMNNNGKNYRTNDYITDVLTDSALSFIERNKSKPFFCYIPYNVPHHPFQVPVEYFNKYKESGVAEDNVATVYGMIDNMDENIGRILQRIEEYNLTENTIIIFMSDNGPAFFRYNDGLAGKKAGVSEGSVRVPFYIQWKGKIPEGRRIFDIAAHIDILPTLLDAAGINLDRKLGVDGISLMPLIIEDNNPEPDRMIFTHQTIFGRSEIIPGGLRTQKYRLEKWQNDYELYDMQNDPSQKRNIAGKKPGLTNELIQKYEAWYANVTKDGLEKPPVPVGYPGYDSVGIIAPDALISQNLKYSGRYGWVDDYVINWKNTNDSVIWEIDVYEAGEYNFIMHYYCDNNNPGAEFKLSGSNGTIDNIVTETKPQKVVLEEIHNMNNPPKNIYWLKLELGSMHLDKGPQKLLLQAVNIPGEYAAEVRKLEIIPKQ